MRREHGSNGLGPITAWFDLFGLALSDPGSRARRRLLAWCRKALHTLVALGLMLLSPGIQQALHAQDLLASLSGSEIEQLRQDLESLAETVEIVLDAAPTTSFDLFELSFEVGFEADDAVAWVRDHVAWVPYHGSLRGADGVLQDRRGNSLDQATLLATLLDGMGFDVRLARGEIDGERADGLVDALIERGVAITSTPIVEEVDPELFASVVSQLDLALDDVEQQREAALAEVEAFVAQVRSVAVDQADRIAAAVTREDRGGERDRAVEALSDHWWVQYDDGGGWVDADPILADVADGWRPEADSTVTIEELPEELVHRVTLQVVAERWEDGAVSEATALEFTLASQEFLDGVLTVSWQPLSYPSGAPGDLDQGEALRTIARDEIEWLPVLTYGEEVEFQRSVQTDGSVNDSPNLTATTRDFRDASIGLGGLGGGGAESMLSAVWIDYTLHAPGEDDRTIRRQIFDLLGEDGRRAPEVVRPNDDDDTNLERGLSLLGETQVLPSVSWLQQPYVQHIMLTDFLENLESAQNLLRVLDSDMTGPDDPLIESFEKLAPLPAELFQYQLYRSSMSRFAPYLYLSATNLVSRHTFAEEREGDIVLVSSVDIVVNDVEVVPDATIDVWRTRLEQGVLDTVLEVVAGTYGTPSFWTGFAGPENAASLLYEADRLGMMWTAVDGPEAPFPAADLHDPDTVARIDSALVQGASVYMPAAPFVDGGRNVTSWWEIDPVSGQTLGIGPRGWGQGESSGQLIVFQAGVKPLLYYASQKTIRAAIMCNFMAATAVIVVAVGVVSAALMSPGFGGIFGFLVGIKAGEIYPVVFQACLEQALFRAP